MNTKIKIGFIADNLHSVACPYLRLVQPLNDLPKDEFEIIDLGENTGWLFKPYFINIEKCDIIIVQRLATDILTPEQIRQINPDVKIVYELDDLLTHYTNQEGTLDLKMLENRKQPIYDYLKKSDLVTVSTQYLKDFYSKYNKNIKVLHNYIKPELYEKTGQLKSHNKARILFAGMQSHDDDWSMIEDGMLKLLREYKDKIELIIWGAVNSCNILREKNVSTLPVVTSYVNYAKQLANLEIDIALCPLYRKPFNHAKSWIKFLEYSACNYAGIYSEEGEYKELRTDEFKHISYGVIKNESFLNYLHTCIEDSIFTKPFSIEKILSEHNYNQWESAYKTLMDTA
jgi:hypothetical protein